MLSTTQIRRNARYLGYSEEDVQTQIEEALQTRHEERKELMRRASIASARLKRLIDGAEAEGRAMTPLESTEYDWLSARLRQLLAEIRQSRHE